MAGHQAPGYTVARNDPRHDHEPGSVVPLAPDEETVRREGYEATDLAIEALLADPAKLAEARKRMDDLEYSEAETLESPEQFWERHPKR